MSGVTGFPRSCVTEKFDLRFGKSMFFCVRKLYLKNKFSWGLGSKNRLEDDA